MEKLKACDAGAWGTRLCKMDVSEEVIRHIERERTVTGGPMIIKSQPMTESVVAGDASVTGTAPTVPRRW